MPNLITVSGIQRVLQILLAERVSIRDLATILEGIADGIAGSRNPVTLTEHVRARLSRQLCAQYTSQSGYLPLIALSAKWEQAFAEMARVLRPDGRLIGYDLLGDGAGRILNGREHDTRVMHQVELRRVLDELADMRGSIKPGFGGLVARFTAQKIAT